VPLSSYVKDKFIACDLSKFTTATLQDMSSVDKEQQYWLANFILNSIFSVPVPQKTYQQIFTFLRRSHSAFDSYASAREASLAFLADGGQPPMEYLDAIGHWEAFLQYAWQAYDSLRGGQVKFFESKDGSLLDRLNRLHNAAKHVSANISNGSLQRDLEQFSPLAVWLTNDGLQGHESLLSFSEVIEILEELARWASAAQDPATMRENISAFYEDTQ
jgi:hypothetical protein